MMDGRSYNLILTKAEAFALRIVRLYKHFQERLSQNSNLHTHLSFLTLNSNLYTLSKLLTLTSKLSQSSNLYTHLSFLTLNSNLYTLSKLLTLTSTFTYNFYTQKRCQNPPF